MTHASYILAVVYLRRADDVTDILVGLVTRTIVKLLYEFLLWPLSSTMHTDSRTRLDARAAAAPSFSVRTNKENEPLPTCPSLRSMPNEGHRLSTLNDSSKQSPSPFERIDSDNERNGDKKNSSETTFVTEIRFYFFFNEK